MVKINAALVCGTSSLVQVSVLTLLLYSLVNVQEQRSNVKGDAAVCTQREVPLSQCDSASSSGCRIGAIIDA